jgi:DNA-binding CsgD family transcriptional regulator
MEAAARLGDLDPLVADSTEAQFHGNFGALMAELRRREGDLDRARAAVEVALDRLEFCTDDIMRIARVSTAGVAVEADRAQRARDRGDAAAARDAQARARSFISRVRAAARAGGPLERAWRLTSEADLARARGRSDPEAWAAAAEAWEDIQRPYQVAIARWRAAEAHLERGERDEAAVPLRAARALAERLGADWLRAEADGLAARGRLRMEEDERAAPEAPSEEPFGLTPRERQVLVLLATGATNREIGASLYMAEKTASVHVSRILAKLRVRSRTQAAAAAHRLGLDEPVEARGP